MLRFARQQLADDDLAEDAVQEALIGALRNGNSFGGRASRRTILEDIRRLSEPAAARCVSSSMNSRIMKMRDCKELEISIANHDEKILNDRSKYA